MAPAENPERAPLAATRCSRTGGRSGSRSASAAASTWWQQAAAHPEVGLIGCEPFVNGVAMALGRIEAAGVGNVRLHPGDARDLIELLPGGAPRAGVPALSRSLAEGAASPAAVRERGEPGAAAPGDGAGGGAAAGHRHRRLCRACAGGGGGGAGVRGGCADARRAWPDWPGTRYEAKALAAGRRPRYLTFVRADAGVHACTLVDATDFSWISAGRHAKRRGDGPAGGDPV